MELPFSPACERNQNPILDVLKQYISTDQKVLEIGHGTGQHADYFSSQLKAEWYPADVHEHNWVIEHLRERSETSYLKQAIEFKIGMIPIKDQLPPIKFDHVYTANTLHIMNFDCVTKFCQSIADFIKPQGSLMIYGPFKFSGEFTSDSNQQFDQYLKGQDPKMGIRDFEYIQETLASTGLVFKKNFQMPANNNILLFQKQ
jgi:ubiquinone/menaquinone biosynthesis C-methylase UbiE